MKKVLALLWIAALCLGLLLYGFSGRTAPIQSEPPSPTGTAPESSVPTFPEDDCRIYVQSPSDRWNALANQAGLYLTDNPELATLLVLSDSDEAARWASRCLDLGSTGAYAQLIHWDLAVFSQGKICAIPLSMEGLGLLCNAQLLAQFCSPSEITDLASLGRIVQTAADAGVTPFASGDLTVLAQLLSALPTDGRDFVNLYFDSEAVPGSGISQLQSGEALFCFGSTAHCTGNISILPVCLGHEDIRTHTLCVSGGDYLCIRQDVSSAQQDAALAFLDSLVTASEEGIVPIDTLQNLAPFRQSTCFTKIGRAHV